MGLLAVPLVLLYILRQKRPDTPVSSTLLWSRTLADLRASTPFQKLRRNLLLLLQLLILAALVFTLMRPVIQSRADQTRASVIVIDCTASMQTTDNGGPSRLDRAKIESKKLIDAMRPGDRYKLIADGGGLNRVGYDFLASKTELKNLIDSIKPSDSSSDLSESLILAVESLRAINGQRGGGHDGILAGKVWLFSDGAGIKIPNIMGSGGAPHGNAGLAGASGCDLLQFVKIGESSRSVGVTQLVIAPVPKEPKTYQVFVGLKNAWETPRKVSVLLAHGQKDNFLHMVQSADLPAASQGGGGSVVFEKVVVDPGKLFVCVDDTNDDFPLDNIAYGIIEPPRKIKVILVTQKNQFLEQFLKTEARVAQVEASTISPEHYVPNTGADLADLVILDGVLPTQLPKVDTLLIAPAVQGAGDVAGFKVTQEMKDPPILRWKREDPLMQYVNLGELQISRALFIERDPELIELASSPEAPLIAYRDVSGEGGRRYFIAFNPLTESNWWRQNSLLIFLQNIIEQTRARHFIGTPQLLTTASAAKLWNVTGSVTITRPDGVIETLEAKNGVATYEKTDRVGFYEVSSGNQKSMFAVNLLSSTESDIRPRSLQTATGSNIEEASSIATVNKEIWQWLAIAALAILLAEWWLYHRRIA